eukprot:jgi/Astpho2/4465/fgenesh1_pm.00067_%23_14_t
MTSGEATQDPLSGYTRFQLVRPISRGAFGLVVCYLDLRIQQSVAVKFIKRQVGCLNKHVEREIVNHSLLAHPHIIAFRECFLTTDYLAISTEYAAGGDLFRYVNLQQGLAEDVARWFFQQIVLALDYMHRMGIANRDLKLENTLLDRRGPDALLKICDFGYSINENTSMPRSAVGTPGYTAPEVLFTHTRTYDAKRADVWSTGVMLYAMLFCRYPFEESSSSARQPPSHTEIMKRIMAADYKLPPSRPVTAECADLLSRILTRSPDDRISLQGIQQHPWYLKNLPFPAGQDINGQYVVQTMASQGDTSAKARAEDIKRAVRTAMRSPSEPATSLSQADSG